MRLKVRCWADARPKESTCLPGSERPTLTFSYVIDQLGVTEADRKRMKALQDMGGARALVVLRAEVARLVREEKLARAEEAGVVLNAGRQ